MKARTDPGHETVQNADPNHEKSPLTLPSMPFRCLIPYTSDLREIGFPHSEIPDIGGFLISEF